MLVIPLYLHLRTYLTDGPNVPFVAGEVDGAANNVDSGSSDTVDYPEHETLEKCKILNRHDFCNEGF